MEQIISFMKEIGYQDTDIKNILNSYSLSHYKQETLYQRLNKNYNHLIELGYTKQEIIKLTTKFPSIYSYKREKITNRINELKELGYKSKDIIKMSLKLPQLLGYSYENINQKIKELQKYGYTKDQIIKITYSYPAIYGLRTKTIIEKIEFYKTIGLEDVVLVEPKQLMQSIDLSYARYKFYEDLGININMNNYRKIFYGQKYFEKKYKINSKELQEKYPYQKETTKKLTKNIN